MRLIKLSATVFSAFLIILATAALPQKICFEGGENYVFFCGTSSSDCRTVRADKSAGVMRLVLKDVCGESAEFPDIDLGAFLKKMDGKILFSETAAGITNYYCSARLPYSVIIDGNVVNLHIAVSERGVKVGSPIIFGGY